MLSPGKHACGVFALGLIAFSGSMEAAENFRMFTQPLHITERGNVTSYVLLPGGGRFAILPPPGWQVQCNRSEKEVTLLPRDLVASIRLKFVPEPSEQTGESQSDKWRQEVLNRYPDAKILREFTCYTSSAQGLAFDLERAAGNASKISMRLAFVPIQGRTVEFTLTAPRERFDHHNFIFNNLLTSFRAESMTAGK